MPGKLACGLAQINKLFLIALAPAANQKVQTFLDAHPQRHGLVHRLREYPHHLAAFGRVFADEFYKRRLPPVSSRENRRVADGRWIVWFLRHQTVPPAGVSNQFISRHSRNAICARCSITQRLLSLIDFWHYAFPPGTASISRMVKTARIFPGNFEM